MLILTGFGENALSSNSDAPETIETWWFTGGGMDGNADPPDE
jgi:hypothetical protein